MADERTWTEEIEIAGRDLIGCVENVIREGNVRRVIVRDAAGTVLLELPLAAGVAVGGALVLAAPVLAALGALAALVTNCRLQIVREVTDAAPPEPVAPTPPPA
ncbi:MAG: DUF4342 domain-containing protein [Myxococcota bacterium]